MNTIIDTLYCKRFCLPTNSNNSNILPCLCGNYNHASCLLQGKDLCFEKDNYFKLWF